MRVTDGAFNEGWGCHVVWPKTLHLGEPAIRVRDWILKSAKGTAGV